MLEWAADQATEITTTATSLEFLPTDNLVFVLQQMHTALMALTSYEANDIVANSRKNPLEAWRRLQIRNDLETGGRKRNLLRTIISPGRCSSGTSSGDRTLGILCVALREEVEGQVGRDDEIKLAGLEALVPERQLMLNSNRLRTFEDARLEIVTYMKAKFGLRIRDSKPSDTGSCGHSDPMDVDAVNSLSSGKGEGSSSPRDGCFKCCGAYFQRDCNARKGTGKHSSGKGKQSKSWSKSEGKGKSIENKGKSKGKSKGTKGSIQGAKCSHKGKTSNTGLSGLENSKSETSSGTQESGHLCPTDNSWFRGGWSYDDWNDDWSSVGWHEGCEQTFDTSESSLSVGSLDLGAMSCPKRLEWVKMNLDTGAAVNTFPLNSGPSGAGDGRFFRTASG